MHVKLKGLTKINKTLASGKRQIYYYAWRGGPLVADKKDRPLGVDDPEFLRVFAKLTADRGMPDADTLAALTKLFKDSDDYKSKSDKTRRAYDRYIRMINAEFGSMPIAAAQQPGARGVFKKWRDSMADRRRTADYAWTTLARVLSCAKDDGLIAINVCERGGRLYKADRSDKIWLAKDIAALIAVARPEIQLALMVALWLGQRQGDLLRLRWDDYDGRTVRLKQGKTGARVIIPVGKTLKISLDAAPRIGDTILVNTRGRAWTEDGFRSSWAAAVRKSGVTGLTFHDIRGTVVTRLALAGCSALQIGAITGHSSRDAAAVMAANYLGGQVDLAQQAMQKLDGDD